MIQISFAHAQDGVGAALDGLIDHHVRDDAGGLDGLARGRVVAGRGDLQAGIGAERAHGLHRSLAEGLAAHHGGTLVVLQGAGHDLAGGGRAFVHQHHHRHFLERGRQFAQRIAAAQHAGIVLRNRPEHGIALGQLALCRHHWHALRQEGGRHGHRCIEQATRIVAQIQHDALDAGILLIELVHLAHEIGHSALLELRQAHPGVARLHHLGAHGLGADLGTGDGDREGSAFGLAPDGQHHLGVGLAAHALDGVVERHAAHGLVVDARDQVAGLDAGLVGGGAFDGRDDLDQAVFLRDLDADADELAAGAFLEFLEGLLVEVLGVRIEARHHAGDGIGDQLLVVDGLHIVALDHAEHGGKLLQLFERQRISGIARGRLERHRRHRPRQDACRHPAGCFQLGTHVFTFSRPIPCGPSHA